jgi:hypothetical protein
MWWWKHRGSIFTFIVTLRRFFHNIFPLQNSPTVPIYLLNRRHRQTWLGFVSTVLSQISKNLFFIQNLTIYHKVMIFWQSFCDNFRDNLFVSSSFVTKTLKWERECERVKKLWAYEREGCPKVVIKWMSKYHYSIFIFDFKPSQIILLFFFSLFIKENCEKLSPPLKKTTYPTSLTTSFNLF